MARGNLANPEQQAVRRAEKQRKARLRSEEGKAAQMAEFGFDRDTTLHELVTMDSSDFSEEKLAAWEESQHQKLIDAEIGNRKEARQQAAADRGNPNKQFKRGVKLNPGNIEYRPGQPGGPIPGQSKFTADGREQKWIEKDGKMQWGDPFERNIQFYEDKQLFQDETGFVYDPRFQGGAGSEFQDNFDWTFNDQLAFDDDGRLLPGGGTNLTPRELGTRTENTYEQIRDLTAAAQGGADTGATSRAITAGEEQSRTSAGGDLSISSRGLQSVLGGIRTTARGRNLGISV